MPTATSLRNHWFVPLLVLLLAVEYAFARSTAWPDDRMAEAAILFDLCLFVPALYLLCYRRRYPARALAIRTAAIAVGGIYVASLLVPPEGRLLLDALAPLRPFALFVLALIELKLLVEAVRLVFGGRGAEEVAERTGAPQWVARLMVLEARFWKALWAVVRRWGK